ncbi:MAG TPA: MFS transporter [Polyangiaceae bacterium]|nr:MFS transporter [Polyangiaceae bacterium]
MERATRRDFRLYQAARLLETIAEQMIAVAVGWQIYDLTGRAFDLGVVGLVQFVPTIALSLFAGHAVDRYDRRRVVLACSAVLAVTSLLFYAASHGGSVVWHLYATLVLFAAARTFLAPAEQALLPDIVATHDVAGAVAWGSIAWEIGSIAGPALGGWIYGAAHGASAVYVTAFGAYVAAGAMTAAMAVRTGRMESEAASLETVLAGVAYVWRNKILLGSISLDLFAVLFGGAVALLPVFARDVLHVGPGGLGLLRSAPAAGAAAAALFIAFRPLRRRAGALLLACVAIYGVATVVFGASRSFALSLAALAVVGAADMVSVVVRGTLVQLATPAGMRGRVNAVNMVFIGASSELGALESGMTAAWLGAVPSVIVGGVAACVVVALYAVLFTGLRRVDALDASPANG